MEFAAILSFILVDYVDGILIGALLLLNACIGAALLTYLQQLFVKYSTHDWLIIIIHCLPGFAGFYEDYTSGNAVAALKKQLAPTCKCLRDGKVKAGTATVELVSLSSSVACLLLAALAYC